MATSLVTEFNLVCDDEWLLPFSQSVFFAGVLVGAAVFGHLGDLLGRRTAFLLEQSRQRRQALLLLFLPT